MHVSCYAAIALLSVGWAVPVAEPQGIDFDAYEQAASQLHPEVAAPAGDVSQIKPFNPSVVATSAIAAATSGDLQKRGTCQPYPTGTGPIVNDPDTPEAFEAYPQFASDSKTAAAPVGYQLVPGFQNLNASASAQVYLGVNSTITSYDPAQCQRQCDRINGCTSFNIYYERDPQEDADNSACPNPPSLTRIKCSYWGLPLSSSDATNVGQYQAHFHVVIAGSNAYSNSPPAIANFSGPVYLANGKAIVQPPAGDTSYMGIQTFPNSAYDPQLCTAACQAKSTYNVQHATAGSAPRICRFVEAYVLLKNNDNPIFSCMYYTQSWNASYATNNGQYDGQGNHYTITQSYTYTLNTGE